MAESWNARIGHLNRVDGGTVSASSFSILTPPANLQNPHVVRKYRGTNGDTESIVVDLGAAYSVDAFALFGLNLTAAGITRVRASLTDPSGQTGDAYDSTSDDGRVDPRYGSLLLIADAPVSARYILFDLNEPGAEYIEAGRAVVMLTYQFGINCQYGAARGYEDRSRLTESRSGQTFIDADNNRRIFDVTFGFVSQAEVDEFVEEIDRVNGIHSDVLLIFDPTSINLGKDSIWGLVDGLSPIPLHTFGPFYSKSYKIRERL